MKADSGQAEKPKETDRTRQSPLSKGWNSHNRPLNYDSLSNLIYDILKIFYSLIYVAKPIK